MKKNFSLIIVPALSFLLGAIVALCFSPTQNHKLALDPGDRAPEKTSPEVVTPKTPPAVVHTNPAPAVPPQEIKSAAAVAVSPKTQLDRLTKILNENYADAELLKAKDIQHAAIQGIIDSLEGSVKLVTTNETTIAGLDSAAISSVTNIASVDDSTGYVKLNSINPESITALGSAIGKLVEKDHITDLIVDLRYSSSTNFTDVAEISSLFLKKEEPLYKISRNGKIEEFKATPKGTPYQMPMVLLVNHDTKGAFELFASVLQDKGRAVIVGNSETARQIYQTADIMFDQGNTLQVATAKVILASGKDLFLKPVVPDVTTHLAPKVERDIFSKPFQKPHVEQQIRFFSEAILTGKETAPPVSKGKKKNNNSGPASNRDLTLLTAIDVLRSVRALGLNPDKTEANASETNQNSL